MFLESENTRLSDKNIKLISTQRCCGSETKDTELLKKEVSYNANDILIKNRFQL